MVLAFSVFWIDPGDLSSKVSVGVTCLLSSIVLQFAEAGMLPEVEYLTLADRIYAVCYVALALSLITTIYSSALMKKGQASAAARNDRRSRLVLPLGLVLAVFLCALRAMSQTT